MKIKYDLFSLRFPARIAELCRLLKVEYNGTYLDLPFILPCGARFCVYNNSELITYGKKQYYLATENTDIVIKYEQNFSTKYYGVINISTNSPQYLIWISFADTELCCYLKDNDYYFACYECPDRLSVLCK